nr:MAG TPA: Receptor tyrosine-protein kinase erbB-3 [Caudoviricetes sp.]
MWQFAKDFVIMALLVFVGVALILAPFFGTLIYLNGVNWYALTMFYGILGSIAVYAGAQFAIEQAA